MSSAAFVILASSKFQRYLADLPDNLLSHLMITVVALGVGVLFSVPLAIFLTRREKLRYPALTIAGVIQTIPSLALLALMVPLLATFVAPFVNSAANYVVHGKAMAEIAVEERIVLLQAFGFWPAAIALTLYSILPILRNTVTGIVGVDAAMVEAARGMGMTDRQVLFKVELPLAAPVIIAGIRTATVWVVGIATLATPVGQRCLGNYIFSGLQLRDWLMVMFGVVGAAALAIILDMLIGGLQKAVEKRMPLLGMISGAALLVVGVAGLSGPTILDMFSAKTQVRIGAKTFTEQYILARALELRLQAEGIQASRTESLGSTIVFDALANGDLDVYVDYSGTIWANYMNKERSASPEQVLRQMSDWLKQEYGITNLGALGFENAYALAMRRDDAERLGIQTISDLKPHTSSMVIGGDYEFFGRPEWDAVETGYGLSFQNQKTYDSSIMYDAIDEGQVDVIAAFSSDGRIAAYDLVVLDDPKNIIPPYDAVLLLGPRAANDQQLIEALQPLIGAIPVEKMRKANQMVDSENESVDAAAQMLLETINP